MAKALDWDKLGKVGEKATLKETSAAQEPAKETPAAQEPAKTKSKSLRAVPANFFDKHAELKAAGKTSLDFSAYIIEALREKLERDGAL
ncbi:hypothetical protein ATY36_13640 [Vibrio cidicii]|uniref:hypothetical protein n=1 Tax=Vibrio cidicii TaxID=1763883 RepID=UPI0007800FBC|nr:hypothetical protein [Vibrio cidicii]KYN82225.1 hypothetical protein ATY36_13640 [Vibrio cidicii]